MNHNPGALNWQRTFALGSKVSRFCPHWAAQSHRVRSFILNEFKCFSALLLGQDTRAGLSFRESLSKLPDLSKSSVSTPLPRC